MGPHKNAVMDFKFHNSLLVSGDKNGVVSLWDINEEKSKKHFEGHKGGVGKVEFLETGNEYQVVTGGLKDGTVSIFDLRQEKVAKKLKIGGGSVNAIKQNKSGFLIVGCADKGLSVVDLKMDQ